MWKIFLYLKRMAEEEYAKLKKQREEERREREMYEDEEWVEEVQSRPRRYAQPEAPAPKPGKLSDIELQLKFDSLPRE